MEAGCFQHQVWFVGLYGFWSWTILSVLLNVLLQFCLSLESSISKFIAVRVSPVWVKQKVTGLLRIIRRKQIWVIVFVLGSFGI